MKNNMILSQLNMFFFLVCVLALYRVVTPMSILEQMPDLALQNSKLIKHANYPEEIQDVNNLIEKENINKRETIENPLNGNNEFLVTAESNNLVYRPLFVYRRVQHTKRRITMFNSFAG